MEESRPEKIVVRTNPKCKYCLGSGLSQGAYAGVIHVCPCVTEQLRIVAVDKDYRIPAKERYSPGLPEFVKE
jgi:hypothetical protein